MKLDKAIRQLNVSAVRLNTDNCVDIDVRIQLVTVLLFIVTTLSIPLDDPASLIWLFGFPVIMAEATGVGYGTVLRRSLLILPLLLLVGAFNPLLDRATAMQIGPMTIDRGWFTLVSLVLRGLLTFQALLIVIGSYGFFDLCRALQWMRCPKVLVTQLLMLYRYIGVIMNEALCMHRARQARGFGRRHYPLRMWGVMTGQLLLRSVRRARRVNNAMLARGFTGVYYFRGFETAPRMRDYTYLVIWTAVFAVIRFVNLTTLTGHLLTR